MIVNMQQLNTYKNLVEIGSFTETAVKLNMTQPGVSQHLKALEEYFGVKLLQMIGKKFITTTQGNEIYHYALKVFDQHEQFLKSLQIDDPFSGFCKMAAPGGIGIGLYSKLLQINHKHPGLSIQFHYAPNKTIEKEIEDGALDLGFMSIMPTFTSLEAIKLTQEKICIITPKNKKIKTLNQLLNLGFITHPDGPKMLETLFSKNFPKHYQSLNDLKISGGTNQIGRILEPVTMGLGFSVISHFAYKAYPAKENLSVFSLEHEVINDVFIVKRKLLKLPLRFDFILGEIKGTFK